MTALAESCSLSEKMKITVYPEALEKFSEGHVKFYSRYACFVLKTLKKPSFQNFLHWMLRRENIEEHMVNDVQVRVLPFKRKNGNGLAGHCDTGKGKIQIYPRTLKFCAKLRKEFGKKGFLSYVRIRARAALIHELLHLKYEKDEEIVRELTKEYSVILTRNRPSHSTGLLNLYNMIFNPKAMTDGQACQTNACVFRSSG